MDKLLIIGGIIAINYDIIFFLIGEECVRNYEGM